MKFHMGKSRFFDRNFSNVVMTNTDLKCSDPRNEPEKPR